MHQSNLMGFLMRQICPLQKGHTALQGHCSFITGPLQACQLWYQLLGFEFIVLMGITREGEDGFCLSLFFLFFPSISYDPCAGRARSSWREVEHHVWQLLLLLGWLQGWLRSQAQVRMLRLPLFQFHSSFGCTDRRGDYCKASPRLS